MKTNKNIKIVKYECYNTLKSDFTLIPNVVFFILKKQPYAFMLYSYLCYIYSKNNNDASVYLNTLQKELGMSKTTVIKNIKLLEEKNLIKIIHQSESSTKNTVNKYVPYYPVNLNTLINEE